MSCVPRRFWYTAAGLFCSPTSGLEKLFGLPKAELLGKGIDDFFIEEPLSSSEYNKLKAMTGIKDSFRIEQRYIRRSDRRIYDLDISGVPISYNDTSALQLVCRDITQKKKELERAIRLQEQRHAVGFPWKTRRFWISCIYRRIRSAATFLFFTGSMKLKCSVLSGMWRAKAFLRH